MTRAGGLLVLIRPGPGRCSAAARHSLGHPRATRHPGVNLAPWLFPSGYPQGHGAPAWWTAGAAWAQPLSCGL